VPPHPATYLDAALAVLPLMAASARSQPALDPARGRAATASAATGEPRSTAGIQATALCYIEGWYTGDAERVARAVHPMLAKRIAEPGASGRTRVEHMTADELVAGARRGGAAAGGGRRAPGARRSEVRVLDVFGDAASVRVDADSWIDYLQMARVDGRWQIVNVLWALRPRPTS